MSASGHPINLANAAWKQVFEEGPYTGFIMLHYLRAQTNLEWSNVLRSKLIGNGFEALRQVKTRKDAIMKDPGLKQIWDSQPGRCTSIAVKVISVLEKQAPDTFAFKIYDVGRHRVARCAKTEVLIDSNALHGAFSLPEGRWVRVQGSEASWRWSNGNSQFEQREGNSGIKKSETVVNKEEALSTCLLELPETNSIPTLFRSFDHETKTAVYHAMIKWQWDTKSLDVTPRLRFKDKFSIEFGGGTDATNLECAEILRGAIEKYGGPHYKKQWASVEAINTSIWDAAIEVWGKPQWTDIPG